MSLSHVLQSLGKLLPTSCPCRTDRNDKPSQGLVGVTLSAGVPALQDGSHVNRASFFIGFLYVIALGRQRLSNSLPRAGRLRHGKLHSKQTRQTGDWVPQKVCPTWCRHCTGDVAQA